MESRVQKRKYSPCFKLPVTFDTAPLVDALNAVSSRHWNMDQSHSEQEEASRLFLRGYPVRLKKGYDDRDVLAESTTLAQFVREGIPGVVRSCLVAVLPAGARIQAHYDYVGLHPHYSNTYRLHIPLKTNPNVDFYMIDRSYFLEAGNCYVFDNSILHAVANGNAIEDRIHVVADIVPNERFDDLLQSSTPMTGRALSDAEREWFRIPARA